MMIVEVFMDEFVGTYANGVVTPDSPLPIPENTRVELRPKTFVDDRTPEERRAAVQAFLEYAKKHPIRGPVKRYTREELYERD